jgi:hypothetical protein
MTIHFSFLYLSQKTQSVDGSGRRAQGTWEVVEIVEIVQVVEAVKIAA